MGRNDHMNRNGNATPRRRPQAPRSAVRAYEQSEREVRYGDGADLGYRQRPVRRQETSRDAEYGHVDDYGYGNGYIGRTGAYSPSGRHMRDGGAYRGDCDVDSTPTANLRADGRPAGRGDVAEGVQPVDIELSDDIARAKRERRRRAKGIRRGNVEEIPDRRQLSKRIQKSFREAGMFGRKASGDEVLSSVVMSDFDRKLVKKKNRWYNFRTNLVMLISLGIATVCMGIIVYQYTTSMQETNDLTDVAETYTEVAAPTAKDTSQLPPIVDFDGLRAINSEISGWLYIPGTVINYPVLTSENQTKYLRKDYKGNHSTNGSIFTDYENSNDLNSDQHIVLYGHHLPWTAMFTEVQKYVEPDFFNSHKLAYFETPETTYVLAPVGSYNVNPDEYDTRQVKFGSTDDFQSYLDKRLARCNKVKDEDTAKNRRTMDKLFTMITCDNHGKARAVVEWTVTASYPTRYVKNVIENAD